MLSLFQRAAQGLPLAPAERAIRQFILIFLTVTGPIFSIPLVGHLQAALQAYAQTGEMPVVPWRADLLWLLFALLVAAGVALRKYATAHHDDQLVAAVDGIEQVAVAKLPNSAAWDQRYQQAIQQPPSNALGVGGAGPNTTLPIGMTSNDQPFSATHSMRAVNAVQSPAPTPTGAP